MLARIVGTVFGRAIRQGTSRGDSPRAYKLVDLKVLVQHDDEADLVTVTVDLLSDDAPLQLPVNGEVVDLLVRVGTYRDAPSARYISGWDDAKVPALGGVAAGV